MNLAVRILAPLALVATLVPPLLYALQVIGDGPMKLAMLLAAVLWFTTAPFWTKGGAR